MKILITYKYEARIRVTELSRFKKMPFYNEKKFGKVCIYDFAYVFSDAQEREYKTFINNLPIKKLKTLNL